MSLRVVRNDITKMDTEAIVNTANPHVAVGPGCDKAVYKAAGYDKLLDYRREHIGEVAEGEVFITPGFGLKAKYIIHAVSPMFIDGQSGEEEKLRSCYRKSLDIAVSYGITSVAFSLISTGSFGYPKEEGMMIAADEINRFLSDHEMDVYLVVFDKASTQIGRRKFSDIDEYISERYVDAAEEEETGSIPYGESLRPQIAYDAAPVRNVSRRNERVLERPKASRLEENLSDLDERIKHVDDTFSEYLMYKIHEKGLKNSEVYKKALVDKKIFSKIKNNPDYHPNKLTAMCLCVGAQLNIDEAKDLLLRAGYGFSPCDKTDIIFEYFIEHGFYDMIDLDIQLEEHGLPCIIK